MKKEKSAKEQTDIDNLCSSSIDTNCIYDDSIEEKSNAIEELDSEVLLDNRLNLLNPDSDKDDFTIFMGQSISKKLRKKALRKLFLAKDFQIIDGLDDYAEDYSKQEKLGDILTSDKAIEIAKNIQNKLQSKLDNPVENNDKCPIEGKEDITIITKEDGDNNA